MRSGSMPSQPRCAARRLWVTDCQPFGVDAAASRGLHFALVVHEEPRVAETEPGGFGGTAKSAAATRSEWRSVHAFPDQREVSPPRCVRERQEWVAEKTGDELWSTLEKSIEKRIGKPLALRRPRSTP